MTSRIWSGSACAAWSAGDAGVRLPRLWPAGRLGFHRSRRPGAGSRAAGSAPPRPAGSPRWRCSTSGRCWPYPMMRDFADPAAFGVTYRTAYHALRSVADVAEGDWVVVFGAGAGVGPHPPAHRRCGPGGDRPGRRAVFRAGSARAEPRRGLRHARVCGRRDPGDPSLAWRRSAR